MPRPFPTSNFWETVPQSSLSLRPWAFCSQVNVCLSVYLSVCISPSVPARSRTSLSQNRAFAVVAPSLWNDTPPTLQSVMLQGYHLRLFVL